MNVDIKFLETSLVGTTVSKPVSGTLSGHAAGEPFDKHVHQLIKGQYSGKTFRQYELLNKLYSDNPQAASVEARWNLITSSASAYLLRRGKAATKTWHPQKPFVEKQNDTADVIVVENGFLNLIDVKTRNSAINGQPPNIISSYKLANMAALMIENGDFSSHDITYVGVTWEIARQNLKCVSASVKELFKVDPSKLYINWAAAMQIQFHVEELDQSYKGNTEEWCRGYLGEFVDQGKKRANIMLSKFVKPFQKFLK